MEPLKPTIVVMPNYSEFGVTSKEARGVVSEKGAIPDALKSINDVVGRLSAKLGVDVSLAGDALAASIQTSLDRRSLAAPVPTHGSEPSLG